MPEEVVIKVAGEEIITIEEVAPATPGVMREVAMGRIADGEMRAAEEVNGEVTRTTGAAQTTEEALMPAVGKTRRMRRRAQLLQLTTTILPLLAARKHKAQHSKNMTPTLSPKSCHTCLHRLAYNRWPRTPTT
jgi:hypothetical protein